MLFVLNLHVVVLGLTALVSAATAIAAWRYRSTSSASKPFIFMMFAIAGYALVAALESASIDIQHKIFWSTLEYVGSGNVITLFLILALCFTGQQTSVNPRLVFALSVVPSLNVVLVATNRWHGLVWSGFLPGPSGSNLLIYQHGPGFLWIMACSYLYTLAGSYLLMQVAIRPAVLHRQQSIWLLAGALVPLLGGTLYMLHLTPLGLNLTPMSFMLTGLIYFVSLLRLRMFDLVPIARDRLIERMSDGVLVLDRYQRIIDVNPAAQRLMGTPRQCFGRFATDVVPQWQAHLNLDETVDQAKVEIVMDPETRRYVELQTTVLRDRQHQLTGHLIVLRDVTERHKAELERRRTNERLQQQLRKIEALQAQLREQAIRDSLTGLFNRRYFEEALSQEIARAHTDAYPIAVILFDVDQFKQINDTFGHPGGDRVLQALGQLLCQHHRANDIACRYGGEELALILPGMTLEQGYQQAEALRCIVQTTHVEFEGQTIRMTVSGGVGIYPNHGMTSTELLRWVDQALYSAKARGRNRIQCCEPVRSYLPFPS